jgi:hypothetical protein
MVVVGCLERRIFFFPSFREKNKERGKGSETPTPTALIESLQLSPCARGVTAKS